MLVGLMVEEVESGDGSPAEEGYCYRMCAVGSL